MHLKTSYIFLTQITILEILEKKKKGTIQKLNTVIMWALPFFNFTMQIRSRVKPFFLICHNLFFLTPAIDSVCKSSTYLLAAPMTDFTGIIGCTNYTCWLVFSTVRIGAVLKICFPMTTNAFSSQGWAENAGQDENHAKKATQRMMILKR